MIEYMRDTHIIHKRKENSGLYIQCRKPKIDNTKFQSYKNLKITIINKRKKNDNTENVVNNVPTSSLYAYLVAN